jgi:hypothetical protein
MEGLTKSVESGAREQDDAEKFDADLEKLNVMQEIMDEAHAEAEALQAYMDAPDEFVKREHEEWQARGSKGYFSGSRSEDMRLLYNAGVRPDDLEELGKREAMRVGDLMDMKAKLAKHSLLRLRLVRAGFEMIGHMSGKNVDKFLPKAEEVINPLVPDPMQGISVKPMLFDINPTNSPEVKEYNESFRTMLEANEMIDAIREEFTRRQQKPQAA